MVQDEEYRLSEPERRKKMETKTIELVLSKVEELIQAAGGGVEKIFPYFIKQAQILGVITLIVFCVFLFCLMKVLKNVGSDKIFFEDGDPTKTFNLTLSYGIIGFFCLISSTIGTITPFALFNPNLYAIQMLINFIK